MWSTIKYKVINMITNIFGSVAGVPQIVEGYFKITSGDDVAGGITRILEGIGIIVVAYFVGKKGSEAL